MRRSEVFIAQSQGQAEIRRNAIVVGDEGAIAGAAEILAGRAKADRFRLRRSQQEIGEIPPGVGKRPSGGVEGAGIESGEGESAASVRIGDGVGEVPAVIAADVEVVFAAMEGHVVGDAFALSGAGDRARVAKGAVVGEAEIGRSEIARIGRGSENAELRGDVIAEREERDRVAAIAVEADDQVLEGARAQRVAPSDARVHAAAAGFITEAEHLRVLPVAILKIEGHRQTVLFRQRLIETGVQALTVGRDCGDEAEILNAVGNAQLVGERNEFQQPHRDGIKLLGGDFVAGERLPVGRIVNDGADR